MRALLRNLRRQRWRTVLTIAGIAIGIFALVVFGAMAEHFRGIVEDAKAYVGGTIRIATKTDEAGENPGVSAEDLATIQGLPGVKGIAAPLELLFDGFDLGGDPTAFIAPKPLVEGLPPELARSLRPGVRLIAGRWLAEGDRKAVMMVAWLARKRGKSVGSTIDVRHVPHEVVGIYEAPELPVVPAGIVPLEMLKRSFQRPNVALAARFLANLGAKDGAGPTVAQLEKVATRFVAEQEERYYIHEVIPADASPAGAKALAERIRKALPKVSVIEPEALAEQMEKAVEIFLAITLVVSVISSVVGGLLIVNTMAMAVVERRREVAIKVAVGASTWQIARELLAEAAVMGLVGALIGVVGGLCAIALLDPWILSRVEVGSSLFKVTPALLASAVSYGVGLGVVAGLVPALRAARSDPASGLRDL